jgi:hypothetical protein
MKFIPILALLLTAGASFASGTTVDKWFAKVPVRQTTERAKKTKYTKNFKGMKAFKTKENGPHAKKSAVLTRVRTK